ncbi:MAG: SDR family NAD(P)-dependent oxidoreductase [Legionella sp.]|nr:SDR family NAD(P)-dependent oxidoreductase [Legionella sp.]
MSPRMWVILGATSIIAEKFAHLVASKGHAVRLVGRDTDQLNIIATDIQLRFHVACEVRIFDANDLNILLHSDNPELDLFIAHSDMTENCLLNEDRITNLIKVNILTTIQLIHHYLKIEQKRHNVIYLSSVAARRGRAKNSLYGASKAAVEIYLQGLQQLATPSQHITIARLGYIDTQQTYGLPGIFYAASPLNCAQACWKAIIRGKRCFYYPFFWQAIMYIVSKLPFFLYKKVP